jgi:hypothetical protein
MNDECVYSYIRRIRGSKDDKNLSMNNCSELLFYQTSFHAYLLEEMSALQEIAATGLSCVRTYTLC